MNVVLFVMMELLSDDELHKPLEAAKGVLRLLRMLRPLRLLRINEGLKLMVDSLLQSVASLYYVVSSGSLLPMCSHTLLSTMRLARYSYHGPYIGQALLDYTHSYQTFYCYHLQTCIEPN